MTRENKKQRADLLLVDQKLSKSRSQAQAMIMAAQVCVGDQLVKKSSELFDSTTVFRLKDGALPKFVSRGGEKLEGALKHTKLNVVGFTACDIGISTGGFTDCLLQNGATKVIGIDVGHNQLAWKIRNDERVEHFEGMNARSLPPEILAKKVDLVVIDVSFISLSLIFPEAYKVLKETGFLLALIKPQFEVEKNQVGKGGIIKDPLLHVEVQSKIKRLAEKIGFKCLDIFGSVIEGTDGNKEFFIFASRSESSH
jgi:23S rRNA (cytidine1920-2'-O)/16S rRNA (cytidine1409-2'-O)-methyltransferase